MIANKNAGSAGSAGSAEEARGVTDVLNLSVTDVLAQPTSHVSPITSHDVSGATGALIRYWLLAISLYKTPMVGNDRPAVTQWHEVFDTQGYTRAQYVALLAKLKSYTPTHLHELEQRLHASLRELGITFGSFQTDRANTWFSDLLPHLVLP